MYGELPGCVCVCVCEETETVRTCDIFFGAAFFQTDMFLVCLLPPCFCDVLRASSSITQAASALVLTASSSLRATWTQR